MLGTDLIERYVQMIHSSNFELIFSKIQTLSTKITLFPNVKFEL